MFESARAKFDALRSYRGGVENDGASNVYCVGCRAGGDVAARSAASPPCLPSALLLVAGSAASRVGSVCNRWPSSTSSSTMYAALTETKLIPQSLMSLASPPLSSGRHAWQMGRHATFMRFALFSLAFLDAFYLLFVFEDLVG
eukprot:6174970-Pleurochrysis_carterae.AAC.3